MITSSIYPTQPCCICKKKETGTNIIFKGDLILIDNRRKDHNRRIKENIDSEICFCSLSCLNQYISAMILNNS